MRKYILTNDDLGGHSCTPTLFNYDETVRHQSRYDSDDSGGNFYDKSKRRMIRTKNRQKTQGKRKANVLRMMKGK